MPPPVFTLARDYSRSPTAEKNPGFALFACKSQSLRAQKIQQRFSAGRERKINLQ